MSDTAPSVTSRPYVLYAIAVVFLVSVLNVVDRHILNVLAPVIQEDLQLSDTQMGVLLGPSFSVVHFAAVLPAAWLADRHARRSIVAGGLVVWSAMTALGAATSSFFTLTLTRMGVGIGEAAGSPPSVALLSDTAPAEWRTRALSSVTVGALVGVAVGMIVGGALGASHGWRVALLAVGLPGLALAAVVRFTLREPPRSPGPGATPLEAGRHLAGFASFRWAVAGVCLANIGIAGRLAWEPSFLARSYGLEGAALGSTYVVISALPSMTGALVGAGLADRLARHDLRWLAWVCGFSILLGTPFIIAFLLWDPSDVAHFAGTTFPIAFLWSAVGSFLIGFFSPPMASLAQALVTTRMRSLAHAIWTMPYTLVGMGVGPPVIGALSQLGQDGYGPDALPRAMVAATGFLPIGAAGLFVAARTLREDGASATDA